MHTIVLRTLRGAGLLAALASAGLWTRSHFVNDHYLWTGPTNSPLVDSRAVFTSPGRLVFQERSPFM
jgi:hypothetical protein